jgi:hypothetical protein
LPDREREGRRSRTVVRRLVPLVVAAVVLYGVAPAVLEVLGAYRRLRHVAPGWWIVVLATSAASNWCMCSLQRLALNRAPWFPVATSQLAGAAFSKVVPGGSAAAAALQARMLVQAGLPPATIGTGLTAGALLLLGALAGLPLLALPTLLFGRHVPDGLLATAAIGLGVFVVLFVVGAVLLVNDRVLRVLGRGLRAAQRKLHRGLPMSEELPERLLDQRDLLRRSLGAAWPQAVATAAGRWIFDFLCLYAALRRAAGLQRSPATRPDPAHAWRARRCRGGAHRHSGARGYPRCHGSAGNARLSASVILASAPGGSRGVDLAPSTVRDERRLIGGERSGARA